MQRATTANVGWKLRVIDAAVITVTFLLTIQAREILPKIWHFDVVPGPRILHDVRLENQGYLLPLVLVVWLASLSNSGAWRDFRRTRSDVLLVRLARASITALGTLLAINFILQFEKQISRTFLLGFSGTVTLALWAVRRGLLRWKQLWKQEPVYILAVGAAEEAEPFLEALRHHEDWGLRIVGVLLPDDVKDQSQMGGLPVLGKVSQLADVISSRNIGQVFMTGRRWEPKTLQRVADTCEEVGVTFTMDANFLGLSIAQAEVQEFSGWPVLTFSSTPVDEDALAIKRGIDILGALFALLISSPLLLLIAILIKLEDGGPIFFSQQRSGLFGRPFSMHKFRSMVVDAEAQKARLSGKNQAGDVVFKMDNDPRITRIGHFIRKTSLDEFPQFWNVLVGEMSLVGPRPPIPTEVTRYQRWQMRRLSMKPGITCIWQVSGRSNIPFEEWMRLDLEYIDNWSLFLDLKLLLLTLPAVVTGRGAR